MPMRRQSRCGLRVRIADRQEEGTEYAKEAPTPAAGLTRPGHVPRTDEALERISPADERTYVRRRRVLLAAVAVGRRAGTR